MKRPILTGILVPFLLSGCQQVPASTSTSPTLASTPAHAQIAFKQEQQRLALTLTEDGWLLPGRITANSQRVTVDWDGDAIELLSALAHQRGLILRYSGVRLPLPGGPCSSTRTWPAGKPVSATMSGKCTLKNPSPKTPRAVISVPVSS